MNAHRFAVVAVALLAGVALAGCSAQDKTPRSVADTGHIDQTVLPTTQETAGDAQVTDGGKAEAAKGNGEIRGVVQDDGGLAIADALVSRIGSEASATTDSTGAFRFTNVSAGTHLLRVTASEVFRVHEGSVTVVADRVTLVTITLVPVDGRGPGYRPHLHDYWGDKTEIDLFDADFDWGKSGSYTAYGAAGEALTEVYAPNAGNWWLYFSVPERGDGLPAIVVPGTAEVRFTITWDEADVDVDRFILGFHPGDYKWRDEAPAGNGDETTAGIAAEDTDNGHQGFSLWQFHLKPEARTVPMTILGPIHIRAVLVKGVLPVDPPHEDFWGANVTYLARSWDTPVAGISNCCIETHVTAKPDSKRLVPPGTGSLDIRMGAWHSQAPGTAADLEWELLAKPADLRPDAPLGDYIVLKPISTAPSLKVYKVPVASAQTDAYYQVNSNWVFVIRQEGTDVIYGLAEAQHQFRLEVIANKDPTYV